MRTLLIFLILTGTAYAGNIVYCDPADPIVPDRVTDYRISVNNPDFEGIPNTIMNPDVSAVAGVTQKHWKCSGSSVVEMSQAEKDAITADESAKSVTNTRVSADSDIDGFSADGVRLRAALLVVMDEVNILRAQHSLAPRTADQLKTAIKGKISDGSAD